MIQRIVKMTFKPESLDEFRSLFSRVKNDIRNFPGCRSLQLLGTTDRPHILFTLSTWDQEEDLEAYRKSPLFSKTWRSTKALFGARAEAWTVRILDTPDIPNP